MSRRRTQAAASVIALVLVFALSGCGGSGSSPESDQESGSGQEQTAPQSETPAPSEGDDAAATLTQEKCTGCHTYDRVEQAEKDRAGWEETVDRMIANGLKVTDEEKTIIIDYLASAQ